MRSLWTHLYRKSEIKKAPTSEECSSLEAYGDEFYSPLNCHEQFEKGGMQCTKPVAIRVALIRSRELMLCPQKENTYIFKDDSL